MSSNTHRWAANEFLASLSEEGGPFEVVDEPVLGQMTMVFKDRPPHARALLARAVEDHADLPYLVQDEVVLTFGDVAASVARVADLLAGLGVTKGDRVAFAAPNTIAHAVGWWATVALGAVVSSLNGWWTPSELAHGIELTQPTVMLADGPRLDRLDGLVLSDAITLLDIAETDALIGPARVDDPALPSIEIDEDDPAIILFTSGTTGRPKGAVLSHRALVHCPMVTAFQTAMGRLIAELMAPEGEQLPVATSQPSTLLVGPLFHVSGALPLTTAPLLGTKVVFPPVGQWDEVTHLRLTQEHQIGTWGGVPAQFWRMLEHPRFDEFDTSCVAVIGGGGAVFSPDLFRLMAAKVPNARIGAGYGMSETFGSGARLGGLTLETHPASVGLIEPLCEIEIRDAAGAALPDGEIGEICIRSASVFLGYWGDPASTSAALDEARWYRTGDFGRFHDGVLQLESRMRDLIIRAGENIYPIEIENRLIEHPEVAEACVIGVAHHQLGQEVAAAIVVHTGSELDASGIRSWVGETLAAFKVPTHVVFREELPYNATGKILKTDVEREVEAWIGARRAGSPSA